MKLLVITPEINVPNEIAIVIELFERGMRRLHLRKKNAGIDVYRNYLQQIPFQFHSLISIHSFPELLKQFPLVGFHCTTEVWKNEEQMKEIQSYQPAVLSASFHAWDEIEQTPYVLNYVFISPVFDSISKQGYKASIDRSKLKAIKTRGEQLNNQIPAVIALGGIDAGNISTLYQEDFDGAAVLGAIWQSQQPVENFVQMKETIERLMNN
ncbi:MAG: thiamine phosphate synthase [Bacteroidota bacterium]|nr:thiamine phosphate synthase [Bacteroidota bacterium]